MHTFQGGKKQIIGARSFVELVSNPATRHCAPRFNTQLYPLNLRCLYWAAPSYILVPRIE